MRITNTGMLYDDAAQSTPGYVLICPVDSETAFLLRPDGSVAHEWRTGNGMTNWSYLRPNGNLVRNERCEDRQGVALTVSGRISEYAPDGTLLWQHNDPYQHHDARRLDDGAIYAAFTEIPDETKSKITGGLAGTETPGGPFGEVIRLVDEAGEVQWEWHFTDYLMDRYGLYPNSNKWSFGHTNTVCPLNDGTYLISSKNLNLIFVLDPANGITWEYQSNEMSGQHDAQMLENGNILVFANGVYQSDLHHSQVLEIDPSTNDVVWRYKAKDDFTSFFSPHMGGAQRLPSGNTLICEGNKGCLFEVTPAGDIVREFVSPHFVQSDTFGRINWLFRARWYAPGSQEIKALGNSVDL